MKLKNNIKITMIGTKMSNQEINDRINKIYEPYQNSIAYYKHIEDYYEMGELTIIAIRIWTIGHMIFEYNKNVYLFDNKNKIKQASVNDIYELGEKNYRQSFEAINRVNQERLKYIESQTAIINRFKENIEIHRKILNVAVVVQSVFNIFVKREGVSVSFDLDTIGYKDGNVYYVPTLDAHYAECYSRLTCSKFDIDVNSIDNKKEELMKEEGIVVNRRFEVHYLDGRKPYFVNGKMFILFTFNEYLREQYSLPAVALWLKSPIFFPEEMQSGGVIDGIVMKIIQAEKKFLENIHGKNDDESEVLMKEHNELVLEYAKKAEKEFIRILNIPKKEYNVIINFLRGEKWTFFDAFEKIFEE